MENPQSPEAEAGGEVKDEPAAAVEAAVEQMEPIVHDGTAAMQELFWIWIAKLISKGRQVQKVIAAEDCWWHVGAMA